ncbi:glycerol kinase GlpK [Natronoglycomyces albus]|uniref:glycerol kinase n=1 Tax=Natronoglycomyces albus TaxID=2811108 RepID=A0A895XS13_9ACTN|nr:glycerol kinase GlpK [Natronoglycomyces albus]QSB04418.1 glycerol kinase GlpK [Natronoglycomyces albus]
MSTARYIAAIDQGTTSSRCVIVNDSATKVGSAQKEFKQHFPQPGWVEHDANDIWETTSNVVFAALDQAGLTIADLAGLGITNQRETTVVWDRETGQPVHRAIVWQDLRTDALVKRLAEDGGVDRFRGITGLPLSTYFSGLKLRWLFDHDPELQQRAEAGELCFGTIDSWLIFKLTGEHATDVTNASRTMLMNLRTLEWDADILETLNIPAAMLPRIRPSSGHFGTGIGDFEGIEVAAALGDQHAALLGQRCFRAGDTKNTYGTGSFLVMNTGTELHSSKHGLLSTVAYQIEGQPAHYALEGSIAHTGALIQWLRDEIGLISHAADTEELAAAVDDTGGAYIVPAFSGLFAPHWKSDARGTICGLTRFVRREHLVRAALEAACWQTRDVIEAMTADTGTALDALYVDGGMTVNELFLQLQADIAGVPVVRPANPETTVLGAAYAAGIATGVWDSLEALEELDIETQTWEPKSDRDADYPQWKKAVTKSDGWVE